MKAPRNPLLRPLQAIALTVAAVMLTAFSQDAAGEPDGPPQGEAAFRAFDLATTEDLEAVRAQATAGDPAAQYAMAIVSLHGLRGQAVDPAASGIWNSLARQSGRQVTERVTRIIPGGSGTPAQARVMDVQVGETARAYQRAYGACVADILGTRPNPEACGADIEVRERRKAAWRAASGME